MRHADCQPILQPEKVVKELTERLFELHVLRDRSCRYQLLVIKYHMRVNKNPFKVPQIRGKWQRVPSRPIIHEYTTVSIIICQMIFFMYSK